MTIVCASQPVAHWPLHPLATEPQRYCPRFRGRCSARLDLSASAHFASHPPGLSNPWQQNDPTNKLSDSDPGGGSRILESAGASKGYGRGSHPHRIRAHGKPLTQKSPQPTARGGWEAGRRIISARQGSRIRQQTSQGVQEESAALQTLTAVK